MAPAVGVVHLGDDVAQHTTGVVAPVHAQRIEDVTEHPGVHQRGHLAALQVDSLVGEERIDAAAQGVVVVPPQR